MHAACLCSGVAGLVYEVLWSRALVPALGNSADASAAVLVAFMGGMGLGAYHLGRLGDRVRDPLVVYALLEGALALCAIAVPALAREALPAAAGALLWDGSGAWAVRLAIAALVVAAPAAVMGATLPLLVRRLARKPGDAGRALGWLYAVNTLGACAGAAVAGIWLVPMMGVSAGSGIAAALNLSAAALALAARGRERPVRASDPGAARTDAVGAASMLAFTSGALVLLLERLWSRLLVLILGHDTYGFAFMLVAAIAGLATGGVIAGAVARRAAAPLNWAAALLIGASAAALGCFALTGALVIRSGPDLLGILARSSLGTDPGAGLLHPLALSLLVAFLPAAAAGAVFPLACAAVDPRPSVAGAAVGRITAWNAAGCVAGALLPTLGLVQWLGVQGALTAGGAAAAVPAVLVLARRRTGLGLGIAAAAGLAAVAALAAIGPSGGVRRIAHVMVGGDRQELLMHAEGRTGTVTVTRDRLDGMRQLFVNAVGEVTTRYVHDQSFSLLGHLGPLLHPAPERALVVCYGAGLTAGAVATHPGIDVTVVDLEARVIDGARLFSDLNGSLHDKEGVRTIVEDGRNHLLTTDTRYDVMTVDSTHPRAVDSWVLYTTEFYELARSRLTRDGILVQWVPLHGMSETEFRILVRTFLDAFPEAQLWANVGYDRIGFTGYALLVGSPAGRIEVHAERVAGRMSHRAVGDEMARWGLDTPASVLDCFVAGPETLARWTQGLPVNTDDRPLTPYVTRHSSGPRMGPSSLGQVAEPLGTLLVTPSSGDEAAALELELEAYRAAEGFALRGEAQRAAALNDRSTKLARHARELADARTYNRRLAAAHKDEPRILLEAGAALQSLGDADGAVEVLGRAAALMPGDPRPWFHMGLAHARAGRWEKAEGAYRRVIEIDPDNVLALDNLAMSIMALGDPYEAAEVLERAARLDPAFHRTWVHLGDAFLARGEPQIALENFSRAVKLAPTDAQAHHGMGRAHAALRSWERAARAHARAESLDPFWVDPVYDRGLALLALADFEGAEAALSRALWLEPRSAEAWTDLGLAIAGQGRWAEAAEAHLRATDLEPELARAWLNLGMALKGMGEMEAAEKAFTRALELDPGIAGT
jgi:tetratricopeptide (TPR) repeat protein/spermidine synthase